MTPYGKPRRSSYLKLGRYSYEKPLKSNDRWVISRSYLKSPLLALCIEVHDHIFIGGYYRSRLKVHGFSFIEVRRSLI